MFEGFTVESDHAPYGPEDKPWTFTARAPTEQATLEAVLSQYNEEPSGFLGFLSAVADDLSDQDAWPVRLEDGRASIEFATAAYMSARKGRPVSLPIGKDMAMYDGWLPDVG
ncbi:MAG: hypothetical protein AAFY31_09540 [Pseudomonadota bacterium]